MYDGAPYFALQRFQQVGIRNFRSIKKLIAVVDDPICMYSSQLQSSTCQPMHMPLKHVHGSTTPTMSRINTQRRK
jgi:hypothetical protein